MQAIELVELSVASNVLQNCSEVVGTANILVLASNNATVNNFWMDFMIPHLV